MEQHFWDLIAKVIAEVGPEKAAITFFQFVLIFLLLLFGSNIIPKLKDIFKEIILAKKLSKDKEKDDRIMKLENDNQILQKELSVLNKLDRLVRHFDNYLEESHRIKTSVSFDSLRTLVSVYLGKDRNFSDNIKRSLYNYVENPSHYDYEYLREENKDYFKTVTLTKIQKFILNDRMYLELVKDNSFEMIDLFFDNIYDYDKTDITNVKLRINEDINQLVNNLSDLLVESYLETIKPLSNLNFIELPEE